MALRPQENENAAPSGVGNQPVGEKAILRIRRGNNLSGGAISLKVFVSGKFVGSVGLGKTRDFFVEPGDHAIGAGVMWSEDYSNLSKHTERGMGDELRGVEFREGEIRKFDFGIVERKLGGLGRIYFGLEEYQ